MKIKPEYFIILIILIIMILLIFNKNHYNLAEGYTHTVSHSSHNNNNNSKKETEHKKADPCCIS
jgi:hypothetical protein